LAEALEGGEGSGKSTQSKHLAEFLRNRGLDVVQTREVGGSPSAEAIRDLWLTKGEGYWDAQAELLLIMAARREHLAKTVFPALDRGAWVISDRFADSTRVYQGMFMGLDAVEEIYNFIAPNFSPDLTLLLDLPVEEGLSRMTKRGGQDDRFQQRNIDFHQKLREAYLTLAKNHKNRFRIIDAAQDAQSVSANIQLAVKSHFGLQ